MKIESFVLNNVLKTNLNLLKMEQLYIIIKIPEPIQYL